MSGKLLIKLKNKLFFDKLFFKDKNHFYNYYKDNFLKKEEIFNIDNFIEFNDEEIKKIKEFKNNYIILENNLNIKNLTDMKVEELFVFKYIFSCKINKELPYFYSFWNSEFKYDNNHIYVMDPVLEFKKLNIDLFFMEYYNNFVFEPIKYPINTTILNKFLNTKLFKFKNNHKLFFNKYLFDFLILQDLRKQFLVDKQDNLFDKLNKIKKEFFKIRKTRNYDKLKIDSKFFLSLYQANNSDYFYIDLPKKYKNIKLKDYKLINKLADQLNEDIKKFKNKKDFYYYSSIDLESFIYDEETNKFYCTNVFYFKYDNYEDLIENIQFFYNLI